MEKSILKRLLSHLGRHAFESFVVKLFSSSSQSEPFKEIADGGEGLYYQPLIYSYGGSLHSVFLLHYSPLELLNNPSRLAISDPSLTQRVGRVRDLYRGQTGYWGMVAPSLRIASRLQSLAFVTNLAGIEKPTYEQEIIPAYEQVARKIGLKKPAILVGSYDSFTDLDPGGTDKAIGDFIADNRDGIRIVLTADDVKVERFASERNLAGGVLTNTQNPYEPVFSLTCGREEEALGEFQRLIRKGTSESELEKFIVAHYKQFFGSKYDRVETQLWLRFPELDIAGSERRLDIFLRNSVVNDWELFEIKRVIKLTSTYRDAPVLAKEVTYALQQLRNYARILTQDRVKRYFSGQGIEYYQPSLNLVVGKTPQIPHDQWRWLLSTSENGVKILTFDDLLAEMRMRLKDRRLAQTLAF